MAEKELAWYYKPWVVIGLLFLVLGPLGLPLLYKSPKFSRRAKVLLTLVMIPYTAYLVWSTVLAVRLMPEIWSRYRTIL